MMHGTHADDGALRAFLDGELSWHGALRTRWHLLRCAACRATLAEQRALARRSSIVLSRLERATDSEAGWRRVSALRGPGRRGAVGGRQVRARWPLAVGATVAAVVVVGVVRGGWLTGSEEGALRAAEQVRDVCCFDLDGGGPGDDGIVTRSRDGELVRCVLVYDDIDRTRTFSPGDMTRFVSSASECHRAPSARDGSEGARGAMLATAMAPWTHRR